MPFNMKYLRLVVLVAVVCLVPGLGSRPILGAGSTLDILQSELQRNFQVLKKEQTPAYYMAYTLHDERSAQIVASFGALQSSTQSRSRFASVEVRVGDYAIDNTHPLRGDTRAAAPRVNQVILPFTDDEQPIRLALWQTTDRTFKQATEAFARVKTNIAAKVKEDDPAPDFSREPPQTYAASPASYVLDTKAWEARLRRVSAPFADDPLILRSDVTLSAESDTRYLTSSEGSRVESGSTSYRLFIQAATKADDGMELPLYQSYFATTSEGLPDERLLIAEVRSMMDMLAQLRKAPLVDPYSGPAILSGRAAGVFFHEIFGHRVEASRQRNADDGQTFSGKVGQPILPSFLSVVFDPTLAKLANTELMGHYVYDDEGVKGQRVTVVDKGVLKTFLLDRAPIRGFPESNGHGRAEAGYVPISRQSNLVVESSRSMSIENLTDMLRTEAKKQGKPFGLLFDNIEGGFTNTGRGQPNAFNVLPNVVYRIYTDEKRAPELVRGVDLIGTPLSAFAKIVATGNKLDVFNGVCGAESGWVPVSASSPPLLVSEVEVQKKVQSMEAAPILTAPRASR